MKKVKRFMKISEKQNNKTCEDKLFSFEFAYNKRNLMLELTSEKSLCIVNTTKARGLEVAI